MEGQISDLKAQTENTQLNLGLLQRNTEDGFEERK